MAHVFPQLATVSLREATPGRIISIARHDGIKLALATNQLVNEVRSFVWLNPGFPNKPQVIFAENWRNESSVLQYNSEVRFEIGASVDEMDPTGRNVWEVPGVIVCIEDNLFIRAAPLDAFYGRDQLVNLRDGSIYIGQLPTTMWTFLAWQLWVRDSERSADFMLTKFAVQRT